MKVSEPNYIKEEDEQEVDPFGINALDLKQ